MTLTKNKFYELGMKYGLPISTRTNLGGEEYYWFSYPNSPDADFFFIKYQDNEITYAPKYEYNPFAHFVINGFEYTHEKFTTVERFEEIIQNCIKRYKETLIQLKIEKVSDDFA